MLKSRFECLLYLPLQYKRVEYLMANVKLTSSSWTRVLRVHKSLMMKKLNTKFDNKPYYENTII